MNSFEHMKPIIMPIAVCVFMALGAAFFLGNKELAKANHVKIEEVDKKANLAEKNVELIKETVTLQHEHVVSRIKRLDKSNEKIHKKLDELTIIMIQYQGQQAAGYRYGNRNELTGRG